MISRSFRNTHTGALPGAPARPAVAWGTARGARPPRPPATSPRKTSRWLPPRCVCRRKLVATSGSRWRATASRTVMESICSRFPLGCSPDGRGNKLLQRSDDAAVPRCASPWSGRLELVLEPPTLPDGTFLFALIGPLIFLLAAPRWGGCARARSFDFFRSARHGTASASTWRSCALCSGIAREKAGR